MKQIKTRRTNRLFEVLASSRSVQAARMILNPGQSTGDPANEHPHSEQWLLVVSGRGRALINNRRVAFRERALILFEKGDLHQITNSGSRPLVTLNFYAPPAYTPKGDVK